MSTTSFGKVGRVKTMSTVTGISGGIQNMTLMEIASRQIIGQHALGGVRGSMRRSGISIICIYLPPSSRI
jgi:hypothetical protein